MPSYNARRCTRVVFGKAGGLFAEDVSHEGMVIIQSPSVQIAQCLSNDL